MNLPDELIEELAKADCYAWHGNTEPVTSWEELPDYITDNYKRSCQAVVEKFLEYLEKLDG